SRAISWISTTPAAGERAPTSVTSVVDVSCMKAPLVFWPGTVARTHASSTVTSARAEAVASTPARAISNRCMVRSSGQQLPQVLHAVLGRHVVAQRHAQHPVGIEGIGQQRVVQR